MGDLNVFCSPYFTGYWHHIQHHAHAFTRTLALKNLQIPIFLGKLGTAPFLTASRQISPHEEIKLNLTEGPEQRSVTYECQLDLARPLDAMDGRIYAAICGLWDAQKQITPHAIYKATGATRRPDTEQLEKIINSVQALLESAVYWQGLNIPFLDGCLVRRDNTRDPETGHYSGSFLSLKGKPGLYKYITDTDRYLTTVPVEYLQLSGKRTERAIAIQTYVLERISQSRHQGKKSAKITYESLFERLAINSRWANNALKIPHHTASSMRRRARETLISVGYDLVRNGAVTSCTPYPKVTETNKESTPIITVADTTKGTSSLHTVRGIHLKFKGDVNDS